MNEVFGWIFGGIAVVVVVAQVVWGLALWLEASIGRDLGVPK